VRLQLAPYTMTHMVQVDADTFPPRELESGNHVAVTSHHDDDIDKLPEG
jgi:hypothetical protein